jgi:hypothetical protein
VGTNGAFGRAGGDTVTAILLVALTLAVLFWFPVRRWFGRWGTTATDRTRVMAGDAAVVDPTYAATLAITIDARPEHIWPWLVQMGYQRGGLLQLRLAGPSVRVSFALSIRPSRAVARVVITLLLLAM